MKLAHLLVVVLFISGCNLKYPNKVSHPTQEIASLEDLMSSLTIEGGKSVSDSLARILNERLEKQETLFYLLEASHLRENQRVNIDISAKPEITLDGYHLSVYEICIRSSDSIIIDGLPNTLENNKQGFSNYLAFYSERITNHDSLPLAHIGVDFSNGLSAADWEVFFQSINQVIEVYKSETPDTSQPLKILLNFDMEHCSKALLPEDLQIVGKDSLP